ncbi:MAG TPA: hypothetical protein VJA27_04350, partial [Patescibacteria group bacterium]|nr:hypothetical protein [Patescibacteria group bacterium]
MWYRRVLVLLLLAECLWGFFPSYIFAYDEHTTHAALTDEIVDFYNLHFPDKVFTSEEKEWIVQGSIDEDLWPRWINHFYDPVYNEGWKAEEMGNLTPELALKLNTLLLSDYPPITSKSWAQSPERQAQYKQFGGNRTWQRAIYELAKNDNKKEAYYTLGHILHLLEDSTVPDHTRNDTHAHPLHLFTGDYGSPYEEYNKRYKRISDGTTISGTKAEVLYKNGVKPAYRQTLDNYFDVMAGYSNNYFFSKDTIPKNPLPTAPDRGTRKYNLPDVVDNDGEFGYGIDRGSAKFRLAKVTRQWNKQMKIYEDYYDLSDKPVYQPILDDYFSRLSREAITNGAGVIELFFAEVEKVKKGEEVIADLPKEKAGITSVLSTVTTVKQGYQTAKTSIKNAANVVSNKVTDIAGVVKIKLGFSTAKNEQKEAVVTVASVQPAPPSMQFPQSKPVQPAPKPKPVPKVQPVVKVPPPVVAPVQEVLGIKITNPDEVVPEVLPESVVSSTPLVLPSPFPTFFGGGGGGASAAQPPSQTTPSSPPSQGGDNQPPTLPTDSTPPSAPLLDALFADVWYTTTSVVTIFGTHSTDTVKVLVYVSPEPSPSVPLPKGEGVMTAPSDWGFAALLNAGRNHFYFGALDEANNTSSLSVPAVLVLDTEPPPVPVVTAVSDGATNVRVTVTGEDALSPVTRYDVEYATT